MTPEQILIVAVLVLVPLVNFLLPLLKKRLEGRAPPDVEPQPSGKLPPARTVPARIHRERSEPADVRPISPLAAPTPPLDRRRRPRLPTLNRGEARRGFVLMTILGPCPGLARSEPLPGSIGRGGGRQADARVAGP